MYIPFFICVIGAVVAVPIHYLSVEHVKFQARYGKEKGAKITEILGLLSGYLLFLALIGVWLAPQPRFVIPIFHDASVTIPAVDLSVPLVHLIFFIIFVLLGFWLLIDSVRGLSIQVSESHKPEKVITAGIYATVRHPQYLGWFASHLGFTFLFSGWYSLLFTPVVVVLLYLLARKEEQELIREFGKQYEEYQGKVPMLIPKLWK